MARNGADILVDSLIAWGVDTVFGLPGDGINGIMEALRQRQDKIRFIQVRHEESAAFMAVGYARWTGRLGCCLATTGPGGVHLLNGLYDAKADRVPVIAITGLPYHDLTDTFTQQDVDHTRLFMDVVDYSARIMGPAHVENTVSLACRTALTRRGAALVSIPMDVQEEPENATQPSSRNVAHHTSFAKAAPEMHPTPEALDQAVQVLKQGRRIAILAGQGALGAREELIALAEKLGAPIVKALLGKGVVPDDHPLSLGGIGLLGTRPAQEAFEECDTLLIAGSTFPYIEYYPKRGQARGVQIDIDPTRIGLRFPVEVGLVADAALALAALNGRLKRQADRSFLESCQRSMAEWRGVLDRAAARTDTPMKPQRIARIVGERLAPDAIIAADSGHNTGLFARYIDMRADQLFAVSGAMASMACGLCYAIAAALAFPKRQVVAFVGDGGLSMLLGELATVVRYRLPIKIVVIKNNTLGQIKWEQMMFLGNPEHECDLQPIDFAKVAEAMGLPGFRIEDPHRCGEIVDEAFGIRGPALIEAVVDPNEPFLPPKRNEKYTKNLEHALQQGTAGAAEIGRALQEEPSRFFLRN
ncbi:MAG TPA: thiamine pyrophosphate-dependent enzyme [Ferrovibrio sp.]|uniref:thiamine pyrophosphate-dependent enzyme n=1 Tax=Ferrovibrio sp. TaxID=1917215 RepID=UPI002B4B2D56|nr:thiamine pyrophosphate-dependent enzyme [Ferrovibrio sp.]HLT77315.1 thiamine pyrophosphate-dependent enzyme [Ferrovibrio sp.]